MHNTGTERLRSLLTNLGQTTVFPHPVEKFEIIETHISMLLLTGPFVYKFLKPLDLGFLDFSELSQRHHFCEEALRLNRRHAADIYRQVIAITGDVESPEINGEGAAIEYALQMRQFDRSGELDKVISDKGLADTVVDKLAVNIARFHQQAEPAVPSPGNDAAQRVRHPVDQNLERLLSATRDDSNWHSRMLRLQQWSEAEFDRLQSTFIGREENGYIRECHGDMHLGNIVLIDEEPVLFDCIDFSGELRWIDVMNDLAFLIMDLHEHDALNNARRLLNHYLEITGDYYGIAVLRYYLVYRALVRAKIAAIRHEQAEDSDALTECHRYIELATGFTRVSRPVLFITRGLSGSGKTHAGQVLLEYRGAVRIRSDVERKRLQGITALEKSGSHLGEGLYSSEMSNRTYDRLAELASAILESDESVIVDATFLEHKRRETFMQLAERCHVPVIILACEAGENTLRQRVLARSQGRTDASEADIKVLEHQLQHQDAFTTMEEEVVVRINTENDLDMNTLDRDIERVLNRF